MTNDVTSPEPRHVPVREAATVMLVRDGERGIEVFMMRRTLGASFAGGLHVFPGGAVDDADRTAEVERVCGARDDAGASAVLGVTSGGLAYWVAAVRECFEEAGVLLAAGDDGGVVRFDDPTVIERFEAARKEVHGGRLRLVELCATEGLTITADAIEYVSHWITPVGSPRRFDTRFFVARAPEAQEPLHDDAETIASLWVDPADALERQRAGELEMMPPTIANLEFLTGFSAADDALAAARAVPRPGAIQPKTRRDDQGRISVVLPGDPGYDELPDAPPAPQTDDR